MIIKSFQTNKIKLNSQSIILLYGKNNGLKNKVKDDLLKDKKITLKYSEKEIIDNSDNFIESLSSKSLFETQEIIFINQVTDKISNIIYEIIDKDLKDIIIILDAENLDKKSKLRSLFEKSKNHICIPFYPDTNETLTKIAFQHFKNKNIPIASSNINLIVDKCNGDRKILLEQIEKIENYIKNGKKIDEDKILKIINLVEDYSISELIDNCLAKNKNKTINILMENNFGREDSVLIIKFLLNKLKKLLVLSKSFKKNNNLELTVSEAKPPIFWKEKEITKKQILNWTPDKIKETLYKINNIELKIKKNYDNSVNLIIDFIFELTSEKTNS